LIIVALLTEFQKHTRSRYSRWTVAIGLSALQVVISNSRGPGTLSALVAELGPRARAAPAADAATAGDIVVVTVPLKNYQAVPVEPLAEKIVIDTNNYYPERDGHIAELDNGSTTTSELLQAHLPTSKVVKAFNHIYAAALTTDGQHRDKESSRIGHRRRRPRGQGDGQPSARSIRIRHGGCGAAEGRLAYPARYTRLRAAAHGRGVAPRSCGGEAVREPLATFRRRAERKLRANRALFAIDIAWRKNSLRHMSERRSVRPAVERLTRSADERVAARMQSA
jgi:hypothetical protein